MSGKTSALKAMSYRSLQALGQQGGLGPVYPLNLTTRGTLVTAFQRTQGLVTDGWPGDATYYTLWSQGHRPSTAGQIIAIARSWCNIGTSYKLGSGGYDWLPDWAAPECDCSGFIASVLGRSRRPQPDCEYWLSTDFIWTDCATTQTLFVQVPKAQPGAIVAYPDSDGKQGHTAIVTTLSGSTVFGVDCASSSSHRGDAVTERDITFFDKRDSRYCVPVWMQG